MKKITTLFKKDPVSGKIIDEVDPANAWALTQGDATWQFDGVACAVIEGAFYRRVDKKAGKPAPDDSIPFAVEDNDPGFDSYWVRVKDSSKDRPYLEGLRAYMQYNDFPLEGTYELIGEKIGANPEGIKGYHIVPHGGSIHYVDYHQRTYEGLKKYLVEKNIKGLVFHHPDGRMCKVRLSDYGLTRKKA